ncbi:FAD-dependent oxidoreductase [Geitlerinema splendidum]|nr:FAD-dependent oxidoreductase [Geitlerinema splendidum]
MIQFDTEVLSLVRKGDAVTGVKLTTGRTISASTVVLAVDAETSARLSGHPGLTGHQSCITVHFEATEKVCQEAMLVVNGGGLGRINHVAPMSVVSKALAPQGHHLVSATLLGNFDHEDDQYLAQSAAYELRDWFPKSNPTEWRPLRVDRIAKAQISQPVGFMDRRANPFPENGLVLAGEHVAYAGIDGAVKSGQDAAVAILKSRMEPASA